MGRSFSAPYRGGLRKKYEGLRMKDEIAEQWSWSFLIHKDETLAILMSCVKILQVDRIQKSGSRIT